MATGTQKWAIMWDVGGKGRFTRNNFPLGQNSRLMQDCGAQSGRPSTSSFASRGGGGRQTGATNWNIFFSSSSFLFTKMLTITKGLQSYVFQIFCAEDLICASRIPTPRWLEKKLIHNMQNQKIVNRKRQKKIVVCCENTSSLWINENKMKHGNKHCLISFWIARIGQCKKTQRQTLVRWFQSASGWF